MNKPAYGRDDSSTLNRVVDIGGNRAYYSGADARFEFDGVPIDDVAYISYKYVEPVKLHYGYASRTRLRVSRGVHMVSGQMGLNFKDPLYIINLLQKIQNNETPEGLHNKALAKVSATNNKGNVDLNALNYLIAQIKSGKLTADQARNQLYTSNKNAATSNPSHSVYNDKPDPAKLRAYRDALWGVTGPKTSKNDPTVLNDNLYLQRIAQQNRQGNTQLVNYDEFVTDQVFGKANAGVGRLPKLNSRRNGFNIKIIFGEPDGYAFSRQVDQAGRQLGAIVELSGVELMSYAAEVTETGEPIRIGYEFIAADIF